MQYKVDIELILEKEEEHNTRTSHLTIYNVEESNSPEKGEYKSV